MHVAALWRYPVKSLAGEPLQPATFTTDGLAGDRLVHVQGPLEVPDRAYPARPAHLPGIHRPRRAAGGRTSVGQRGGDTLSSAAPFGRRRLTRYAGPERFDILNLLVATDGQVRAAGLDVRRLRPNILIGGVEPGEEDSWPGHALVVGDVVIGMLKKRARCVVTTIDPDTGAQDLDVHRRIRREFGGVLCLDSWVIQPGTVAIGDPARLVSTDELPTHIGGWIVGRPYAV